jgi:hypothetical protein
VSAVFLLPLAIGRWRLVMAGSFRFGGLRLKC